MRPRRPALRWPRLGAAVLASGLVAMVSLVGLQPVASAEAPRADALTSQSVTVSVVSVSPSTLIPSTTPTMLTVVLSLTNTSGQTLTDLALKGSRSNPISTRSALDAAIAKVQPPDQNQAADYNPTKPVTLTLGPGQSAQVPFVAQTSTDASTNPGLCVCNDLIYPLYFTATAFDRSSAALVVGSAQTYVVAFSTSKPSPVQVAWVWPLIDRPHRLASDTAFLDDALATSVSSAGRLDRMLQVVEAVASRSIAMTLVIDPELIGEVSTMASGYTVQERGKAVAGTGGAAAAAWLDRLRAALALDSKLEVDLTPLADPDVESLTRNGLGWTSVNPQVSSQVSVALGGHPVGTNLAWPADQSAGSDTLSRLVSQGNTAVILDDRTLRPTAGTNRPANQLGVVQTPSGQITAHVTDASIQRWVAPVLTNGGPGLSQLPQLVSEVSIDAVAASQQTPSQTSHYVCIVAPRLLNPAPDAAAAAILQTADTYWSQAITIGAASTSVPPADHAQLVAPDASAGGLPPEAIAAAQAATDAAQALNTMFRSVDATTILGAFPVAVQRSESTAWRYEPDGPQGGVAFA
ncbi:MAG: hypothetical protein M3O28_13415, partial [Actinomycetota bacterium]|nr:hypothetical protein [Actinomycetota bacterium]